MFGHSWLGMFSKDEETNQKEQLEMMRTWLEALKHLYPRDLRRGLTNALKSGKAFVPSLPEFLEMCRPSEQELLYPEYKAIARDYHTSQEVHDECMSKLKQILRGKN